MKKYLMILLLTLPISKACAASKELLNLRNILKSDCILAISKYQKDFDSEKVKNICTCYADKHYEEALNEPSKKFEDQSAEMLWAIKFIQAKTDEEAQSLSDASPQSADYDMSIKVECFKLFD